MKTSDLIELGIPAGEPIAAAMEAVKQLAEEGKRFSDMKTILGAVVSEPQRYIDHAYLAGIFVPKA